MTYLYNRGNIVVSQRWRVPLPSRNMETTIKHIEFDFTNHFGTPFRIANTEDEQWHIEDVKKQVWNATNEADLKEQIEMLYGFEVKNIITDYQVKEAN